MEGALPSSPLLIGCHEINDSQAPKSEVAYEQSRSYLALFRALHPNTGGTLLPNRLSSKPLLGGHPTALKNASFHAHYRPCFLSS